MCKEGLPSPLPPFRAPGRKEMVGAWMESGRRRRRTGGRAGGDGRSLLLSGRVEFMHPLSLVPFSSSPFSLDFWGSNTWRG